MDNNTLGLYVHVPFCKSKCSYCNFVSFAGATESHENYFKALMKEAQLASKKCKQTTVDTVFIGGGTPSYVDSVYITTLLSELKNNFKFAKDVEITLEANPESITEEKLSAYKKAGINRLSIGLQTTNAKLLGMLNRPHSVKEYTEAVTLAKEAGFENINTDLMLGLPNQRICDVKKAVKLVTKLGINHISAYDLILEKETPLQIRVSNKLYRPLNEGASLKMQRFITKYLKKKGINRYEVSNYAASGYECKHNLKYWNGKDYLGLGIASHSLVNDFRFSNTEDLNLYIENISKGELEYVDGHTLTDKDKKEEYIMLGLRKVEGIDLDDYKHKFSVNLLKEKQNEVEYLLLKQLIKFDGKNLKVTEKGFEVLNSIIYQLT